MAKVNNFYRNNQYVIICPECKKVKRHRTWLDINDLDKDHKEIALFYLKQGKKTEVVCPQCSKNGKK